MIIWLRNQSKVRYRTFQLRCDGLAIAKYIHENCVSLDLNFSRCSVRAKGARAIAERVAHSFLVDPGGGGQGLTYYRAPTPWVSQQTTLPVRSHTAESHRSYHLQNLDAAQPRQKDAHRKLSFAKNNAFWENPEKNWLQFSKNQAKF